MTSKDRGPTGKGTGKSKAKDKGKTKSGKRDFEPIPPWRNEQPIPPWRYAQPPPPRAHTSSASSGWSAWYSRQTDEPSSSSWDSQRDDGPPRAKSRTATGTQWSWGTPTWGWAAGATWAWKTSGAYGASVRPTAHAYDAPQVVEDWMVTMGLTSSMVQLFLILSLIIFYCGYHLLRGRRSHMMHLRSKKTDPTPLPPTAPYPTTRDATVNTNDCRFCHDDPSWHHGRCCPMKSRSQSSTVPEVEVTSEPEEASSVPTGTVTSQRSLDIAAMADTSVTLDDHTEFTYYTNANSKCGHMNDRCASSGGKLPIVARSINYGARAVVNWCPTCAKVMGNHRLLSAIVGGGIPWKAPPPQRSKKS